MIWEPGHKLQSREYIIQQELGRGGFSVTYKAYHEILKKNSVIKIPNSEILDRLNSIDNKYIVDFYKEAILLAELEYHPHIIRVTDAFAEDYGMNKIPCIVMDLIEGKDLWDRVKTEKRLSQDKAVKYISKIGSAIDYLHKQGLVHCDVHPGNIMIKDNDEAVLIDFGLAQKISAQEIPLKQYEGHPNFIPYEQTQGEYNYTADIYALAASLYYIVTGDFPQANPLEPQLLGKIKLSKKFCKLNDPLKKAILKGMGLKPGDRPKSMSEWLNMLPGNAENSIILKLPKSPNSSIPLISVSAVDYKQLEKLLQKEKWYGADVETAERMCQVIGKYQTGRLSPPDLVKFPQEDLNTINELWLHYSNHRFGFSIQKKIYQDLGGTSVYQEETWKAFCEKVGGWTLNNRWLSFPKINRNINHNYGYFPMLWSLPLYWVLQDSNSRLPVAKTVVPFYKKVALDVFNGGFMGFDIMWTTLLSRDDL